jgi:uncharacterized protein (TIGR00730 family)
MKIKKIAIFGDAEALEKQLHYKSAYKIAKILAEKGIEVVNGGGPGVMEAATLGAKDGEGKSTIVTINPKKVPKNFEGTSIKNLKNATKIIRTQNFDQRILKLLDVADAYIVMKGGTGTLLEMALCWQKAKFNFGNEKPMIFYGKGWKNIYHCLKNNLPLTYDETASCFTATTVSKIIKIISRIEAEN